MQRHGSLVSLCLILALLFLIGCGNGGGGNAGSSTSSSGGGGNGGNDPVEQQKQAVMDDISAFFKTLPHNDPAADAQSMLEYVQSRPEFIWTGIEESTGLVVGATFSDGETISIYLNNLMEQGRNQANKREKEKPLPEMNDSSDTNALTGARGMMPASNKVYLINNCLDTSAESAACGSTFTDLAAMFNKNGYVTYDVKPATLDQYRQAADGAGVTVFFGHGTVIAIDNVWLYFMQTRLSGKEINNEYRTEMKNRRMARAFITENTTSVPVETLLKPYWFISSKFVRNYWKFSEGSLVLNNTCFSSFTGPILSGFSEDFMLACHEKGAALYLGWAGSTKLNASSESVKYFFDTALGTNLMDDRYRVPAADGTVYKNRPYDFESVFSAMHTIKHYEDSQLLTLYQVQGAIPLVPSNLILTTNFSKSAGSNNASKDSATSGFLAPTIRSMDIMNGDLYIYGVFGDTQGTVTVGGTTITNNVNWTNSQITCTLPHHGEAGFSGDVIVEVNGHRSNAAQLTEWPVPFSIKKILTFSGWNADNTEEYLGDQTCEASGTVWIRADVRAARTSPADAPHSSGITQQYILNLHDAEITSWDSDTSKGMGVGQVNVYDSFHQFVGAHFTLYSKIDGDPVRFDGTDPRGIYFAGRGTVDHTTLGFTHSLQIAAGDLYQFNLDGIIPIGDHGNEFKSEDLSFSRIDLDPGSFTIKGDQYQNPNITWFPGSTTNNLQLQWSTTSAIHPPDPDAGR